MLLRPETGHDAGAIGALVAAAFRDAPHASGTEADIVRALRLDGALTVSLVAEAAGAVVGHVAFSPVTIGSGTAGWFGLGPLAVERGWRRQGLGRRLVETGLGNLRSRGADGCVVLGDPAYYTRFGFTADPAVILAGVPAVAFQVLYLSEDRPQGQVRYHPAFEVV